MSTILIENFQVANGFTDLATKGWDIASSSFSNTGGKFGGHLKFLSSSSSGVFPVPFIRYMRVGMYIRIPAIPSLVAPGIAIMALYNSNARSSSLSSSNSHLSLSLFNTYGLALKSSGSILRDTSASGVLGDNVWQHLEIIADINASGSVTVYLDGNAILTYSGDTLGDGTTWSSLGFNPDSNIASFEVSDIYIQTDASTPFTAMGAHQIESLTPSAGTAAADWTGTFADVDDVPHDSDTTYISSGTLNDKSAFEFTNVSSGATVHSVGLVHYSRKDDVNARGVTPYIDSGGTELAGSEAVMTSGYRGSSMYADVDPNTAAAWTESAVNALKGGVEVTT